MMPQRPEVLPVAPPPGQGTGAPGGDVPLNGELIRQTPTGGGKRSSTDSKPFLLHVTTGP